MIDPMRMFKRRRGGVPGFNCANQALPAWHARSRIAAAMVVTAGGASGNIVRVADFGCGDGKLATDLAALGPAFACSGYDLHPQQPDVTRLDLVADPLPTGFDVAVVLGVLEYVADPGALLCRLRATARHLVVSYVDAGPVSDTNRLARGWQPLVAPAAFEALLAGAGFAIAERAVTPDAVQRLWLTG